MVEKRVHIVVIGKVQGVFYRASTVDTARSLGLKGWVRNLSNGNVEIIAEGAETDLIKLYEWCKTGPRNAMVRDIDISWDTAEHSFTDFNIAR